MAQALATTLVVASLYALLGAGYVLVYRASRVLNLAQGDLLTLGGYFLFATAATFPGAPVLALPLAAALSALTGVLVYVALMRPMAGHPVFAAVLVTVTLGILLRAAIVLVFTDRTRHPLQNLGLSNPPRPLAGGAVVSTFDLVMVGAAVAFFAALFVFLKVSPLGIRMRAAGERALLASQRGINFHGVFALSWALSAFAGGLAGMIYSSNVRLEPSLGILGLRAFAVALVGGLDSLGGVVPAALLVAAVEAAFAAIGALALNVLTGLAGQISLGHAGFLAAGAFTTAALVERGLVSPLVTLPATALVGGVLGLVVGMPSLRLKGLYLALGTLAMHHVVLYAAGEMQARAGGNTGFTIPPPRLGGLVFRGTVAWYYALVVLAALVLLLVVNLQRSRAGRAWMAIRDRDVAAASVGIDVARYKLSAFVWSSVVTALAGALFAYHRGFVSVEAFGFFVAVEYIAMIIIGGLGSALGAVLGAAFVTLLPYVIDALVAGVSPDAAQYYVFPAKFGAFGLLMALFLLFEPLGLVGIWRRVRNWFALWPFRHRPLRASS